MRRKDLQAFLDRPWHLFADLRARRQRSLPPSESFLVADVLRRSVRKQAATEARALGRALDLEHHLRLKALLERADAARRPHAPR